MRRIVRESCLSDKAFQNAVNSAFESFLNLGARAPEYLSLFMDDRLRRGVRASRMHTPAAQPAACFLLGRCVCAMLAAAPSPPCSYLRLAPRAPALAHAGLKGASEDDVDATLDRAMVLFRFLQEKDLFEKYYKQHLAKRLLSGRTARPHLLCPGSLACPALAWVLIAVCQRGKPLPCRLTRAGRQALQ